MNYVGLMPFDELLQSGHACWCSYYLYQRMHKLNFSYESCDNSDQAWSS